jgi:hypothetical protein
LIKRSAGAASDPILLLLLFDDSKDDELTSEKRNLMINEWWLEGFRVIIEHTINFSLNNLTEACLSQPLSLIRDIRVSSEKPEFRQSLYIEKSPMGAAAAAKSITYFCFLQHPSIPSLFLSFRTVRVHVVIYLA